MAERLAEVIIDVDGADFVFRVRPGDRVKRALAFLLSLPASPDAEKRDTPAAPAVEPNRHEIAGAAGKPSLRRFTAQQDKAIATAYLIEGLSIPNLVAKFGGTQTSVGAALDREGVSRRTTSESLRLAHKRRKAATEPATVAPRQSPPIDPPCPQENPENPAPLSGRTDNPKTKVANAPGNGRNEPTRAKASSDLLVRDREIERLYVVELRSPNVIAMTMTNAGQPISNAGVMKVLHRRGVAMRDKRTAQLASRVERGIETLPKPKPVEIPPEAKRVVRTVAELTPDPVKYKTGRDAVAARTGIASKRAAQQRNPLNLTDAERQAAVDEYVKRGGAITVVKSVDPAGGAQPNRANVGIFGDGKRR